MVRFDARISSAIQKGRLALGLTLAEVSLRLGINEEIVSLAETKPTKVPMRELAKLIQAYGVFDEVVHLLCCRIQGGDLHP